MRSLIKISLVILAIIVILVAILFIKHRVKGNQTTTRLYTTTYSDITEKISAAGAVVPHKEAVIAAGFDGYIKKIYVKTGQHVKANDPLVSIVELLQLSEKDYPMLSPFDGEVVIINKSPGQYVPKSTESDDSGNNYIMKVADLTSYFVKAKIPEMNIARIRKGQKVLIKVVSVLNKTYHGVVETIAEAPLSQKQSFSSQQQIIYPVRIKIEDPDDQLRIGMSAVVDIIIAHKAHVITLPHEYLHQQGDHYYVVLANGDKVAVKTGLQNVREVEITQGLTVGEKIQQINFFKR